MILMINRWKLLLLAIFCSMATIFGAQKAVAMTDEEAEELVRQTYQYVAAYNVNNKFALDPETPNNSEGYNKIVTNTALLDHTVKAIARPNNDTLYVNSMLDLRKEPVILDIPAFDSKYVSLMVTGYDHYVNVPMSVTKGDFEKGEKVLFYTERTEGYDGSPVEGVDRVFEMTGDFLSAVFRVMPHTSDKARFDRIISQMESVKVITLSEFQGKSAKPIDDAQFPDFGRSDLDVYENNFLEVMQFVVNHITFDPSIELDKALLDALAQFGVAPGNKVGHHTSNVDGKQLREIAAQVQQVELARAQDPAELQKYGMDLFKLKGDISLSLLVFQSVIGPLGLPASEAMYPTVTSKDGTHLNAMNDYVIHMTKETLAPAKAFWSLTLYDTANGFFIPNDHKKYSVGENAGMKLNEDGGLDIYIAAQKPDGVPAENWLPINRQDENIDLLLRIYGPDLALMGDWQAPQAEILK